MLEANSELPKDFKWSFTYIRDKIDEPGWDVIELLQHSPPEALNNKGIILDAVHKDGAALQYASEDLRNDPEVVEAAIDKSTLPGSDNFLFASDNLRSDRKFILKLIHKGDWDIIEYMSEALKNDEEILLEATRQHDRALTLIEDIDLRNKITKLLNEKKPQ